MITAGINLMIIDRASRGQGIYANDGSGVRAMTLEHYPGMTERALEGIVEQDNVCRRLFQFE